MTDSDPAPNNHRRKPQRSPNYPYVDLPTAMKRAQQIYDKERRAATPWGVVAEHWGYSSTSSSMDKVVGALNAYGLLDVTGSGDARELKLSKRALDIIEDVREASQERLEAIQAAALAPAIHRTIREKYGHQMPSDANVRTWLVRELDFNPKAVGSVIANYSSSIKHAGLDKPASSGDHIQTTLLTLKDCDFQPGNWVQWTSQGVAQFQKPRQIERVEEFEGEQYAIFKNPDGTESGAPVTQLSLEPEPTSGEDKPVGRKPSWLAPPTGGRNPSAGTKQATLPLDSGTVLVEWPSSLTPEDFEDIQAWLKILERKIGRSASDEAEIGE